MLNDAYNLRLSGWTKPLSVLSIVAAVAGCSQDSGLAGANKKLEQANRRIATLEAQLAEAKSSSRKTDMVPSGAAPVASAPPEAVAAVEGRQWIYDVTEEKMTGGKRRVASVKSSNTVEFGFPYTGVQHGRLLLCTDTDGKDVMFRIGKGQNLCTSYEGCSVQVRFDDGKPTTYSASGPADHSSTVIFLDGYGRFLSSMRKAKRVRIAVNMYQQGAPVFEFDVSGFDIDKYQTK